MKKSIYYLWAERVFLPKRLWKLLQIFWKPVRTMLECDPSEVDDKRGVWSLYYLSWSIEEQGFTWTLYWSRENAEMQKKENTKLAIWRVMQEKWYRIKEFDEKTARIEELEKENEELKSLPPVEVEHIWLDPNGSPYPKFDDPQNENLTESKKRGRSTWEK